MNRRNFIKKPIVAGTAGCMPNLAFGKLPNQKTKTRNRFDLGMFVTSVFQFRGQDRSLGRYPDRI
jgi:hypothetical protein